MKIKKDNYIGLYIEEYMRDQLIAQFMTLPEDGKSRYEYGRKDIAHIYFNETNDNYLITKSANETVGQIKLSNGFFDYLKIPNGTYCTFLLNEDSYYRMLWTDKAVFCVYVTKVPQGIDYYFSFEGFSINFEEKNISYGNSSIRDENVKDVPHFIQDFLKLAIFIFSSDTELEILGAHKKNNRSRNDGKIFNDSSKPLHVVHSKWNVMSISPNAFGVRGHLRFQPYGSKDDPKVKVIFIEPFEKQGYSRTFKKVQ